PNIKSYAEDVIPVITANQPDAIIIVGTDQWCQKIFDPILNPIKADYKKNVMYSFHYDACSHYQFLGDFRNAQKHLPVFVSEWSAVHFNGDGPFCASNSDELIVACEDIPQAPQLVSWCIWNWGYKDEASSFFNQGYCAPDNLSKFTDDSGYKYSDYVIEKMAGIRWVCCIPPDAPWYSLNTIPSTPGSLWHWDYFDFGGEGLSYHDQNSSAYKRDEKGNVVGYSNDAAEVDVFSLANKMHWTELPEWTGSSKKCPWSTVEDGKVVAFDSTIATLWKDENGNPTYKSLNAGRMYYGTDGSDRPDEGVDLYYANMNGTDHEGEKYSNIGNVEAGEWINYTVNVEKPGYYKIRGIISSEYKAANKNGEISIISEHRNLLRSTSALKEDDAITKFGFPKTTVCADSTATDSTYWNCWAESDAISGDDKEVLCAFEKAGEQRITIEFYGDASGVGPLIFEWYKELDPEDPIVCGDCGWDFGDGEENGSVDDVDATKFSINPNPTSGEFTVTLADKAEASVEVVNMAGQVVASQKVEGSAIINKALTAGVYTVIVKTNAGVSTQKLVVK
ncbi:MAG: T9SS type A sorting domain-containing protein, partial [Paludibacteraceae bacterium]|nr:T9SS type A sorting domain-containing protein [Paludibacteraceae bacterium]